MWINASSPQSNSPGSLAVPPVSACAEPWEGCCRQGNVLREAEERLCEHRLNYFPKVLPGFWIILIIPSMIRDNSELSVFNTGTIANGRMGVRVAWGPALSRTTSQEASSHF